MKHARALSLVAAALVLASSVRPLVGQQLTDYPMPVAGNALGAPMGYMGPQAPALLPAYQLRPATLSDAVAVSSVPMATAAPFASGCAPGCCIRECWSHGLAVFGEFLYLQARNADVAYGAPWASAVAAYPSGRLGVVDQDYDPGFRFGVSYVLTGESHVTLQYSRLESRRGDRMDVDAPSLIRSLVSHPQAPAAPIDFTSAVATHDIDFDFLDVDYRRALSYDDAHNLTFLVGARMGQFSQDFRAVFSNGGAETVQTEIDFYGAGLRLGLEGERFNRSRRWLIYGKTAANFLAGDFTADYTQHQTFSDAVVDTTWRAGRVVPMLDLELGVGWQSRCGTWRLTGGYMISAWYNTVKTDEWIEAVQDSNYADLSGAMTFDGLVLRCEGRF